MAVCKAIYLAASPLRRQSEHYERFYYKLGHRFPGAEIIEHGWPLALLSIDTFVFMCNSDNMIDEAIWAMICKARSFAKPVFLACMEGLYDDLALVPFEKLTCQANSSGSIAVEVIVPKSMLKRKQRRRKETRGQPGRKIPQS